MKGAAAVDVPGDQDLMQRFLAERDIACPACSYNLRGLSGRVCPECSQGIELSVLLSEPRLGAYLASIVGLSMASGPPTLVLGAVVLISFSQKGWPSEGAERWCFVWAPLIAAAAGSAMLWRLARRPGRVWFLQRKSPWAIVGACWALALVPFVVWLETVMSL